MISFTEDWYAAKVKGPILNVNSAGAVNAFLKFDNNVITGNYGVFYAGKAKLIFMDNSGQKIGEGVEHNVSPLENFNLSESVTLPDSTKKVQLCIYDENGNLINILDELTLNPTGIKRNKKNYNNDFNLNQNYPNPFNPSTVISYQIPALSHVTLKIYDVLGKEISTLVNEEKNAGIYKVKFDASSYRMSNLTTGIYFYRITIQSDILAAGTFSETKKMLLIR
jgi:flagellar hook assembly protein FlgD